MTTDDLKRLRADAEKIVGDLCQRRNEFKEPINWDDLHCTEARMVTTDSGKTWAEIVVSEAATPDYCTQFCNAVQARLAEAGWPDVQVRMEW